MSCKVCEFFKEAHRNNLFWIRIGWIDGYAMNARLLKQEEMNYCPSCGRTLKEETDDNDMGYAR